MTTTTENKETKKAKKPADMYLFEQGADGKENKIVGSIYRHTKGNGFSVLMNGKRYMAFPPKAKAPEATEGKGA